MIRPHTRLFIAAAALLGLQACVPLVVGGAATGAAVVHDRRSSGTILGDQGIELGIRRSLAGDKRIQGSHINITSYNHVVLLTGEVPDRETGLAAGRIARAADKVRQVHNELVITEPSSLAARSNDSLITGGVKSTLLAVDLPGFDPTRVKVVTERNVVYLLGLVTREEADAVSDRARRVSGVEKVVRLFEIIP
jgi:osmotically-inducible protein OsmY